MDDDKRRRSVSRHSSRASRSLSPVRSRRYRRRSVSRSRSRSVERRRHRRRSVSRSHSRSRSRSRSRGRRQHKSRTKSSRHHHSSKKRSRSRSRSRTKSERKSEKNDKDRSMSSKKPTINYDDLEEDSNDSSTLNNKSPNSCHYHDEDDPIDKERIHREIEQKLRETLAREGKVYPPKKPEASHPVFANDGSFLEIFKKIQEQQNAIAPFATTSNPIIPPQIMSTSPTTAAYVAASVTGRSAPPPPIVGRRRGGKILKTGMVAKQRLNADGTNADPKDFWSLYLAEVNKYKNTACETETGNRPLVK